MSIERKQLPHNHLHSINDDSDRIERSGCVDYSQQVLPNVFSETQQGNIVCSAVRRTSSPSLPSTLRLGWRQRALAGHAAIPLAKRAGYFRTTDFQSVASVHAAACLAARGARWPRSYSAREASGLLPYDGLLVRRQGPCRLAIPPQRRSRRSPSATIYSDISTLRFDA